MVSKEKPASQQNKSQGVPDLRHFAAHPVFISLLLAASTIIFFWPVVRCGFINYDDPEYITSNPRVQEGLTWKNVGWAFTTDHSSNWHPLTWLSHMLDETLFGTSPVGPHCVNLLLHTTNVLLLFFLLKRMTGALWQSAFVAALFALHPQHVESVAWVAERKDALSTMFWMLTLLAYVGYVETGKGKGFYAQAIFTFAMGLMSKPMLVTLPFVLLLLDFWPLRRLEETRLAQQPRTILRLVSEKTPFLLLSAMSCTATLWAQRGAIQSLEHLSLSDRVANAVVSYARYLGKAFWPEDLALPYLHRGPWPNEQVVMAATLVTGLSLVAILNGRKYPYVITGWFWYLVTLVPVIGLVQVGAQAMADRYTYVPLTGVFIIVAWGAGEAAVRWPSLKRGAIATSVLILAACGVLAQRQVKYWRNSETLFKHAASVTQDNIIALSNVGGTLFAGGRLDEAMEYYQQAVRINPNFTEGLNSIGAVLAARGDEAAIEWFRKALAVQPTHADALFNMGNFLAKKGTSLAKKGNSQEAAEFFQASLKVKPDNYEARNNLANVLVELGRIDEAIVQYRLALEYKPEAALIHKNLGETLATKGKLNEAILHYRRAIALTNDAGTHYSLGMTLAVQGKWDEAIEQYNQTLRLWPTNAEAYYNLGYALRMQGRLNLATTNFLKALRLKPDFPLAHFNLGCALADQNRTAEAVVHLQEALRLKPDYEEVRQKLRALGVQPRE